jgi:hypothetical protein
MVSCSNPNLGIFAFFAGDSMNKRLLVATVALCVACSTSGSKVDSGGGAGGVAGGGSGGTTGGAGANGSGGASATGAGGASATGRGGTAGATTTGTGGAAGATATGTGGATATGTGGTTGTGGATGANSVLERNLHPSRDGAFTQPTLTKAAAARMAKDTAFAANFTGNMWASPVYLENGPGGKGLFFAVTTGNDVIALDETTGATVWTRNIGAAAAVTGAPCGNINPIGILATPVIDAQARTIYVAGAVGNAAGITSHVATAISVDDGTVRAGWPVNISGKLAFDPTVHNQRSALSLVKGILYVAYGGHVGDCGAYRGRVVAINTATPTQVTGWATGGQGEAIWAAGGMASDGTSVFALTGNHTPRNADTTRVDSEEVVRISGMAVFDKTSTRNYFFPTGWSLMDSTDADFGANSPVLINVPGSTPANMLVAIAKDGNFYLLDAAALGGANGNTPLADVMVSNGAMSIHTVPAAYATAAGTRVTLSTDTGAQCPGGGGGEVVMAVAVPAGAPPKPATLWCAPIMSTPGGGPASPIATTTDGKANAVVWIMSGTHLMGYDGDTGAVVFAGGNDTCTNVRKWTSPIAVKGRIVVGGDGHLCSWSPH